MSYKTPRLPLPIRLFNRAMASLGPWQKQLISLEPDALLRKAQQQCGLQDFGSDYFRDPLERLCLSLENDARLTALGRIIARQQLLDLLSHRLQFIDIFKRHPDIAEQPVIAPIFILGMPRTGTTSMHELMALDPQFRVPLSWEVDEPFPPPRTETYHTDPRINKVAKKLAQVDRLLPDFKYMHPMGAELPQECVALFSHDFTSMIFDVQFRLKSYQAWLLDADMGEAFRNHRRWLQLLQWQCPADTWVLKSPQHLWNVEDLLREYPDARVIQTHRDPVKVALSVGSLTATLRSLASEQVDLPEVTAAYADYLAQGSERTMAARAKGLLPPEQVIDVQFAEFRQNPIASLARVYSHFGKPLSPATTERMQHFLDAGKNSERHGRHHYRLQDAGIDLQQSRARFASYVETYAIPLENI